MQNLMRTRVVLARNNGVSEGLCDSVSRIPKIKHASVDASQRRPAEITEHLSDLPDLFQDAFEIGWSVLGNDALSPGLGEPHERTGLVQLSAKLSAFRLGPKEQCLRIQTIVST